MTWVLLELLICHTMTTNMTTNIIRRANSVCAFILRNFASRNASFMYRIFIAYIRPVLEYASQLWSPSTVDFINRIERV